MRSSAWLVVLLAVVPACGGRAATDRDRVLVYAGRDLHCPTHRDEVYSEPGPVTSSGVPTRREGVRSVEAITLRQLRLGTWEASCAGRSATYRCTGGVCRRDDDGAAMVASPWLEAGSFECQALGEHVEGSAAAAVAVAGVDADLTACGVTGVVLSVTPINGALALDALPESAPEGADRCVRVALLHADASPPPPFEFLFACRAR